MGNFMQFQAGQQNEKPAFDASKPNKYFQGENVADCYFDTYEEYLSTMQNPLYEKDPEFREAIRIMLSQSKFGQTDPNSNDGKETLRKLEWQEREDQECAMESAQELFDNPKYDSSPTYRKWVRQQIEANAALIDKTLGKQINGPTKINGRIQFQAGDMELAQKAIFEEKQAKIKQEQADAAAHAAKLAGRTHFDVVPGMGDDEGEDA